MIHRFTLSIYTVGLKLLVTFVQFTRFEKTTTLAIEGPSSLDWKIPRCSPFISLGSKCWYQAFVSLQAVSWVRKLEKARRILWKVFSSGEVSVKLSFRFHWSNNSLSGKPNLQIKKAGGDFGRIFCQAPQLNVINPGKDVHCREKLMKL